LAKLIDNRSALILLSLYTEPADEKIGALVAEFGAVETLELLKSGRRFAAVGARINQANWTQDLSTIERKTQAAKSFILTAEDSNWPTQLNDLDFSKPHCLWVSGEVNVLSELDRLIAVVGARAATNYGERIATEIGALLGEWGSSTVSGAAYGIDAAAHRGSISSGGTTVAVLACGLDLVYPTAHAALLDRIRENGVIVAESPPSSLPLKQRFLSRNRIIAALSKETVVVEAALRSGSLSTANWAIAIGRKVWGVPGPITSATSAGVHLGIRNKNMEILMESSDLVTDFLS
jgi:DNA processing protein